MSEIEEYSIAHLQEWAAYAELEPFGFDWFYFAQLTNVIANCMGRGKNSAPYKMEQWQPIQPTEMSQEEMKRNLLAAFH